MKYLLSTNQTTTNIVEYVSDFIRLNLSVRKHQIPYFNGGTDDMIHTVVYDELEDNIRKLISSIIERLVEYKVDVVLDKVIIKSNSITILININNNSYTYDIATGDLQ